MAEIFICPPDALTDATRDMMREAGVIVVETDRPNDCKFIRPTHEVSDEDMLWAAVDALNAKVSGTEQRERLASNLLTLIIQRRHGRDVRSTPAERP